MTPKQDLLDLLATLPEVDTVDKRKAFLGFVGFSYLGIYLNWEGSSIVFSSRLVEELGRRGPPTMVDFLDNLPDAPQVGADRKPRVARLAEAVKALDAAGWNNEFGVPPAAPPPSQSPDMDMLALAMVSTVLVPVFKDTSLATGQAASQVAARLEQALAADPTAVALWTLFKQTPEAIEPAMVPIIKAKLAQDAGLSRELADLTILAIKELTERKPGDVEVAQRVRLIQDKVLGAAIGSDVIKDIRVKVSQVVDTVGPGGSLTGVTIGKIG